MTKEALKLALEAMMLNNAEWKRLADSGDAGYWSAEDQDHYKQTEQAITAIKAALEAKDEPVQWKMGASGIGGTGVIVQPQRTWVGLTTKEFQEAVEGLEDLEDCWVAIEAKLRIKNHDS
jgi:hypothetical protein